MRNFITKNKNLFLWQLFVFSLFEVQIIEEKDDEREERIKNKVETNERIRLLKSEFTYRENLLRILDFIEYLDFAIKTLKSIPIPIVNGKKIVNIERDILILESINKFESLSDKQTHINKIVAQYKTEMESIVKELVTIEENIVLEYC